MDLAAFVEEALKQILSGIRAAQASDGGGNINAEHSGSSGNLMSNVHGVFTRVDFDVAVSAEAKGGGRGSLRVFGAGVEGGMEQKHAFANRVVFSVPVKLPPGKRDASPAPDSSPIPIDDPI